jgi:hypothetical protein
MPFRSRAIRWGFVAPTFIAAFALIFHLTYLFVWPVSAVTEVRMQVLDQGVYAGDTVRFAAQLCKHVEGATELHYALRATTSNHYYDAGMEYGNNPKGCMDVIQHFHVPADVPPGDYEAWVVAVMHINALRTDIVELPMGDLTVLEK